MPEPKFKPVNVKPEAHQELSNLAAELSKSVGTRLSLADTINILLKEYRENHELKEGKI